MALKQYSHKEGQYCAKLQSAELSILLSIVGAFVGVFSLVGGQWGFLEGFCLFAFYRI